MIFHRIMDTKPGGDYGIRLHQSKLENAKIFNSRCGLSAYCAARLRRSTRIAELGVMSGLFSIFLHDLFVGAEVHLFDLDFSQLVEEVKRNECFKMHLGYSHITMSGMPDNYFDFIYVDGDHSYEGVSNDIIASLRCLRDGGIIQFNDYANYGRDERRVYGVLEAVNGFLETAQCEVVGLSLERSGYHDLAVIVNKDKDVAKIRCHNLP